MNKKSLPLMALRDIVVFPGVIAPVFVGRQKSLHGLSNTTLSEEDNSKYILVTLQKKFDQENPNKNELYDVGILAKVIQIVNYLTLLQKY